MSVKISSILVPLDGSTIAELALPWALNLAQLHQAELVLLRVGTRPDVWTVQNLEHLHAYQHEQETHCLEYLRQLESRLKGTSSLPMRLEYVSGDPGKSIVARARDLDSSMIVMNSHGREGLSRWLLGSVTDRGPLSALAIHVSRFGPFPRSTGMLQ